MIVEQLEADLRAEAAKDAKEHHRWNRGSALGYCPRRLGYMKLGIPGAPMTPRRLSILGDGIAYDLVLKDRIQRVLKHRVIDGDFLGNHEVGLEGVPISYHIDMGMELEDSRLAVVEIKTASNRTFEKALEGKIDIAYLAQSWFYHYATGFPVVMFVFYRKETSHICEVVFDVEQKETIVMRRYNNDAYAMAVNDPMLIAEIKTPFDAAVEAQVRDTVRTIRDLDGENNLPVGTPTIEPETIKVQGRNKAREYMEQNGIDAMPEPAGSWYTFTTGRQIAGFPCSYCGWIERCLGARLEIKDERPLWVISQREAA
jgi:hypothetical protein